MKRRISIFLLAACLLLSPLMGCAPTTPPIDDTPAPTPDTTVPDIDTPIDGSIPEQNTTTPEPESESAPEHESNDTPGSNSDPIIINSTDLTTIDQLIVFNKNPSLLNSGSENGTAHILAEHRAGTILSRDYIYVPSAVFDGYELWQITQTPIQIAFTYHLSSAEDLDEMLNSMLGIYFNYSDVESLETYEREYGVDRDADGFLYIPSERRIYYQVEENCVISVYSRGIQYDYQAMCALCDVQKVNVTPTAVTE